MKIIYALLFLLHLVAGIAHTAVAQQCLSVPYTDMLYQFPQWDWQVAPVLANNAVNPQYCKTWAVRRLNDGRSDALVINAPWVGAANGTLLRIANEQDYTKAKGWELLRMNLGGVTAVAMPHFILYNKYTGIIRTFFYLDNSAGTYNTGVFVTMEHSTANGGNNSGVLAMTKSPLLTPEKYLSSTDNGDEIITYVTKLTAQVGGWIVADFMAGYDPNSANARYNNQALQFSVHGVTENRVVLTGDFNFVTDKQEGYGFAGKKSAVVTDDPIRSLKTFTATGQKVLGVVDKIGSFADKFAASSLKTSRNTAAVSPQASAIAASNANAAATQGPSAFKKILNTAAGFNAAFGIIGSVVGLLWPDAGAPAAAPVFIPTVSNGSISMTGTITTTYPLYSISVRVPGTPHPFDPSTQTYYDCPLGIFTIKNTPVLALASWGNSYERVETDEFYGTIYEHYTSEWHSYQVNNDLVATYNEAAGLRLQSVQAAIVVEQSRVAVYGDEYMRRQIASGEVIITSDDGVTVTYQTPFIGLGDFKHLSLTVATNERSGTSYGYQHYFSLLPSPAKIYIRVAATLERKNAGVGAAPILYVQDYVPQVDVGGGGQSNPRYDWEAWNPNEPVYSNLLSALAVNAGDTNFNRDYTLPAGTYNAPLVVSAAKDILFPGTNPAGSTAVFDHSGTGTSYLLSNTGIALGPGFSVTPGTDMTIATPLQGWKQGGTPIIESNGPTQCAYNTTAYRVASSKASPTDPGPAQSIDALEVYPNPTRGKFSVTSNDLSGGTITIYDAVGRMVKKIAVVPKSAHTYQVDLAAHGAGFYIVRLQTSTSTTSKKLLVE